MSKARWSDNLAGYCDTYGCDDKPEFDFGYHLAVVGIPGEVRQLCHRHARGLGIHKLCGHTHEEAK